MRWQPSLVAPNLPPLPRNDFDAVDALRRRGRFLSGKRPAGARGIGLRSVCMVARPLGATKFRQASRSPPGIRAGSDFFERSSISPSPIRIFKEGRWDIDRISLAKKVIELGNRQCCAAAAQELVCRDRELFGGDVAVVQKHAFLADGLENGCAVPLAALALRPSLVVARVQPEAFLQVDVTSLPPADKGGQIVTAGDCQCEPRIVCRGQEPTFAAAIFSRNPSGTVPRSSPTTRHRCRWLSRARIPTKSSNG